MEQRFMQEMITGSSHKPKKKIRLTSLFFTLGLALMCINFFIDITHYFTAVQPHTLGGAVTAFTSSIIAQFLDA